MLSYGNLITVHRGLEIAKEHCGHKGLAYLDAQLDVERELREHFEERDTLRYDDRREYLRTLFPAERSQGPYR